MPAIGGSSSKRAVGVTASAYLRAASSHRTKIRLRRIETRRILLNIACVSCAFMLLFTANQSTLNIQSSINPEVGTVSLAVIFGSLGISSLLLPTYLIKKLGAKYVLALGMSCFVPYISFQLYPRIYTLIPCAVIVGLGAAPMWSALCTYVTHLGQVYATIQNLQVDTIIVRFFGFFYFAWQISDLWGNLISSLVISEPELISDVVFPSVNSSSSNRTSTIIDDDYLSHCGPKFCPSDAGKTTRPPDSEILTLVMILLPCIAVALVITLLFLDPLKRYGENREGAHNPEELTNLNLIMSTIKLLTRPNLILLIPITIWNGMEQGFVAADFTRSFVACIIGLNNIGYCMICFGICDASCSILFGIIMKYSGRLPIVLFGAISHYTVLVIFLKWHPDFGGPSLLYILAGAYGMSDAVWQTQINGLYGTLFRRHKEAAFANYRLWESIGYIITFSSTNTYCTDVKIYCLLGMLTAGILGYLGVEIRQYIKGRNKSGKRGTVSDSLRPTAAVATTALVPEDELIEEDDDEIDYLEEDIIVTNM